PITYQESVSFTQTGGTFVLDLLSNDAIGTGFDSAVFNINVNGALFEISEADLNGVGCRGRSSSGSPSLLGTLAKRRLGRRSRCASSFPMRRVAIPMAWRGSRRSV